MGVRRSLSMMFGSQTQSWSYVKQQSLDEAAEKVGFVIICEASADLSRVIWQLW